ncbi:DNA-binding transcriptional MerR regulator [Cytobacillus horneckiae]|uniref:DUF3967 domain-containing protein n=1 Tax=Cytobacillus horneckiae TaxID=549687 RepID=UPI0019D118AE|nr:DUF3967 domain-containing protein [Cytobacillus horneckiae]MBN6890047.1 DUF3967 domain-containing protein [Cytobacillus horneckiae]
MNGTDTPYSSKEVIDKLKIGDSTLRKWCLALEEQNYNFIRTDQNKRLFSEKDVYVLSQFKTLVQDKHLSINTTAEIIAEKYTDDAFSSETQIEQVPNKPFENETLKELKSEVEQLKDMNRLLLNRLDEQQKYIEKRLEKHDEILLNSLRESQETKKLLLEAKEEEQQKKSRKGLLKWFVKD